MNGQDTNWDKTKSFKKSAFYKNNLYIDNPIEE